MRVLSTILFAAASVCNVAFSGPIKLPPDYSGNLNMTIHGPSGKPTNVTIPANDRNIPAIDYTIPASPFDQQWVVALKPNPPEDIPAMSQALQGAAKAEYPNSNLIQGPALSDNSLVIEAYSAQHAEQYVGAIIVVSYHPHGNDPTNIHWIQVLREVSGGPNGEPHQPRTYIDSRGTKPYYDQLGLADKNGWLDKPHEAGHAAGASHGRDSVEHDWQFELYVATGPDDAKGDVTVYSGIKWGWYNKCLANCSSTVTPPSDSYCPDIQHCFERSPAGVPEPTTGTSLTTALAGAAITGVRRLCRRRNIAPRPGRLESQLPT